MVQIGCVLLCFILSSSSVIADNEGDKFLEMTSQIVDWAGQECDTSSQKLENREIGFDTCNDFCKGVTKSPNRWSGSCQLHDGCGECQCIYSQQMLTGS